MCSETPTQDSIVVGLFSALYDALQLFMRDDLIMRLWDSRYLFVSDWQVAFNTIGSIQSTHLYCYTRGKEGLVRDAFGMLQILLDSGSNISIDLIERLRSLRRELEEGQMSPLLQLAPQISESSPLSNFDKDLLLTLPGIEPDVDMDQSSSLQFDSTPCEEFAGVSAGSVPKAESVLSKLWRFNSKGEKVSFKKENFRMQHIRALKRSLRQLNAGTIPGTGIHRVKGPSQQKKWGNLKEYYFYNRSLLDTISGTQLGPKPDRKQLVNDGSNNALSYNDTYCEGFFSDSVIRHFNVLFTDLVYGEVEAEELCTKSKHRCCFNAKHTEQCEEVWKSVQRYALLLSSPRTQLYNEVVEPEMYYVPLE